MRKKTRKFIKKGKKAILFTQAYFTHKEAQLLKKELTNPTIW